MTKLSIVILNYRTKELTLKCIESLINVYKEELKDKTFEIILVDNNSEDSSIEEFKKSKFASYFLLIEGKENVGFGGGNNLGAKNARGKYVLFLNSDTEVKDRGLLKMVGYMDKNEKVGILGGKLYFPDGKIQTSVGKFYNLPYLFLMLLGFERLGLLRKSPENITVADWVSGACMIIRKSLFEKIEGFDQNIFMYMEDVEICYRAKQAGFSTLFYPDVAILHKERGSSNKTFAILNIYKGIIYFYKKHKPFYQYFVARMLLGIKAFVLLLIGFITFNKNLINTYRKALRV